MVGFRYIRFWIVINARNNYITLILKNVLPDDHKTATQSAAT